MNDRAPPAEKPRPLEGVRVLDLTTMMSGPYCTYQLALLGAEVTKIERPGKGDWTRQHVNRSTVELPEFSINFVAQNAAKRSVTLDLKSEAGLAVARQLIARSDILVENFSAGVADRLGIGFEDACRQRPDLVYCAISGYGQDGPFAGRPAYDHVIQAASGITMLIGTPETVPNRIGPPMFDYLAGIYGAFSVLAALRERDRTGRPQMLDVSMLDAGLAAMSSVTSAVANGGENPQANGNTAASGSPASGIFETQDGLISLTANQVSQFERLCRVVGLESILLDPRFVTEQARRANSAALRALLQDRLRQRTARAWEEGLSQVHVPAARVRTVSEVLDEPQVRQRQVLSSVTDPVTGRALHLPTIGFNWNKVAVGPTTVPPRLGEHTDETLAELGYDGAQIKKLREESVI